MGAGDKLTSNEQPATGDEILIRKAVEEDVPAIAALINRFAAANLMLARTEEEIYRSLRNFLVAEDGGKIVGCGALAMLSPTLAEIRSLAVDSDYHKHGIGRRLVETLVTIARARDVNQVCALTLQDGFFQRLGFRVVDRWAISPKLWGECVYCPKFHHCDEIAVMMNLNGTQNIVNNKLVSAIPHAWRPEVVATIAKPAFTG